MLARNRLCVTSPATLEDSGTNNVWYRLLTSTISPAAILRLIKLDVILEAWIIEDGNYDDFASGETREFALEFYAQVPLEPASSPAKQLSSIGDLPYRAVAEVVFVSDGFIVLDFGVLAYSVNSSDLPSSCKVGDYVEGVISIGVDPYFYFEQISKKPETPPLIYKWRIDSIDQDTTPLLLSESGARSVYVRDEKRRSSEAVASTAKRLAAKDSAPSFILHCTSLETKPSKNFGANILESL